MKHWKWLTASAALVATYIAIVMLVGFESMAIPIHFGRVAMAVGVLVLYLPAISMVFKEVPAPRRDYLLAGIILSWVSAICFTLWNEAGRQFGVETSIFQSPVAGFFSLLLVVAGIFHIFAPDMAGRRMRIIAVAAGVAVGVAVAVVAPLFR